MSEEQSNQSVIFDILNRIKTHTHIESRLLRFICVSASLNSIC